MSLTSRATLLILGVSAAVTAVFFVDLCGWIFQCGCTHLWAGADMYCNIHNATGRHCPFCAVGAAGQAAITGTVIATQAAAVLGTASWSWPVRLIAGLAAFPVTGWALGLLLGWWTGYWA